MYTKLSREKERISATRWGDTKEKEERERKRKRRRRSRHPNECDIVAIRRTAASFVRRNRPAAVLSYSPTSNPRPPSQIAV